MNQRVASFHALRLPAALVPRRVAMVVPALLVLASLSCVNRIRPPSNVADPVTVYVADHGKHSSLLLPAGNAAGEAAGGARYLQYAFGDWGAFAENRNSLPSYLRAALFSRRSALGREAHPTDDPALLRGRVRAVRLTAVVVERAAAARLRDALEREWTARSSEALDNRQVRMVLVPYAGPNARYALWNHCNHATARWLRHLGCGVWRPAMFSAFRLTRAPAPAPGSQPR